MRHASNRIIKNIIFLFSLLFCCSHAFGNTEKCPAAIVRQLNKMVKYQSDKKLLNEYNDTFSKMDLSLPCIKVILYTWYPKIKNNNKYMLLHKVYYKGKNKKNKKKWANLFLNFFLKKLSILEKRPSTVWFFYLHVSLHDRSTFMNYVEQKAFNKFLDLYWIHREKFQQLKNEKKMTMYKTVGIYLMYQIIGYINDPDISSLWKIDFLRKLNNLKQKNAIDYSILREFCEHKIEMCKKKGLINAP